MNLQQQRAVQMIESQLEDISKSAFPSDEVLAGFIEANYAHGFIDEAQQRDFQQRGADAVLHRRSALRIQDQNRKRQALSLLYRGAA
ncbi:hypothetical protein [Pseudomonas syringae]|nr:hypothetical protein [Pseudomonas syringae]